MRVRRRDFDTAVATHGPKVYTLALYLLADPVEAEDVTQEVLVRLWRRGSEVAPERIRPWLLRVARNACIDSVRRRRGTRDAVADIASLDLTESSPNPECLAHASELGNRILRALKTLREPGRSVVVLREIQGMSYEEIGEVLTMSTNNVRVTLHRARRRLRNELKEVYDHVAAC